MRTSIQARRDRIKIGYYIMSAFVGFMVHTSFIAFLDGEAGGLVMALFIWGIHFLVEKLLVNQAFKYGYCEYSKLDYASVKDWITKYRGNWGNIDVIASQNDLSVIQAWLDEHVHENGINELRDDLEYALLSKANMGMGSMDNVAVRERQNIPSSKSTLEQELESLIEEVDQTEFDTQLYVLLESVKSLQKSYNGVKEQFNSRDDSYQFVQETVQDSYKHVMRATREFVLHFKNFDPDSHNTLKFAASARGDLEGEADYDLIENRWLDAIQDMAGVLSQADIQMKKIMLSQGDYTQEDSELYLEGLEESLKNIRQGLW